MTTRRRDLTAVSGPTLFDFPMDEGSDRAEVTPEVVAVAARIAEESTPPAAEAPVQPGDLFAFEDDVEAFDDVDVLEMPISTEPSVAGIAPRLLSGGADLLIHCGVLAATTLGLYAMAATPRIDQWPALAVLLVAFSFFYTVVSLAFWGQTAGMAWCELHTHDRLERPLSFRQAVLRWAGGLLSLALAGLPVLLAFRGTSLTDLLSASVTVVQPLAD